MTRTRVLLHLTGAAAIIGAVVVWPAPTAFAADGVSYGWWLQPEVPLGVTQSPPDVPSDGMYVEHNANGDVAMAAIAFGSDPRLVKSFILHLTGAPVITQPLKVCPLGSTFRPAESGPWSERPRADCAATAAGVVNQTMTTVTFAVSSLNTAGTVGFAIFATGNADRAPITRPASSDVTFEDTQPTPSPAPTNPPPPASVSNPPVGVGGGSSTVLPGGSAASMPPLAQQPAVAPAPTPATPNVVAGRTRSVASSTSVRRTLGIWLGLLLALICIAYWSDGLGALPMRSRRRLIEARRALAIQTLNPQDQQ